MKPVTNFRLARQITVSWALAAAPALLLPGTASAVEPTRAAKVMPAEKATFQRPREVGYIVAPGDTLIGIARKLLRPDLDWRYLRAVNGLNDARQLVPGQRLRVPANWLKKNTVQMKVNSFSGDVHVNGTPVTKKSVFSETDVIETGIDGTVLVTLPDGTEMQIAPSSQVRIERLRKYFGNEAVDARLRLEKGGVDTRVTPSKDLESGRPGSVVPDIRTSPSGSNQPTRQFLIETPKATASVRGTEFRVIEGDDLSSSAVLEGNVDWSAGDSAVGLDKGFGSTANETGDVTAPEPLLKAPGFTVDPKPVTDILTRIKFEAIDGAKAYRVRVAADAGFTAQVSEQIVDQPALIVSSKRDGLHYIAVRGISTTGVEGYDGKSQVNFEARPIAPNPSGPQDNSTQFSTETPISWLQPRGVEQYRLQIARDNAFSQVIVDEEINSLNYQYTAAADEPAPRKRWWRIASLDQTGQGPWSAAAGFTQRDPGPAPSATTDGKATIIQWAEIPEASYVVLLKPLSIPGAATREIETAEAKVKLTDLGPGRYEIRTVAEFEGGLRSPPGEPQEFTIKLLWRDGFGDPISGSDEEMLGIQPD